MKSSTLPSFWTAYKSLDKRLQASARKAYLLWRENPFHPSLHFKVLIATKTFGRLELLADIEPLGLSTVTR